MPVSESPGIASLRGFSARAAPAREWTAFPGQIAVDASRLSFDIGPLCRAACDPAATTVVWNEGMRPESDVFCHQDLGSDWPGKEFGPPGLAPSTE